MNRRDVPYLDELSSYDDECTYSVAVCTALPSWKIFFVFLITIYHILLED